MQEGKQVEEKESTQTEVKIYFGDDVRKSSFNPKILTDVSSLYSLISEVYSIDKLFLSSMRLLYCDEEQDWVTINSDFNVEEVKRISQTKSVVKLKVSTLPASKSLPSFKFGI